MSPTPQHKDTTLDELLDKHIDDFFKSYSEHASIHPADPFVINTFKHTKAKQALLQWRDNAVVEELETVYHKHGRTYKQTVVDGSGNVYVEDSHRYISSYEVQERILELKGGKENG